MIDLLQGMNVPYMISYKVLCFSYLLEIQDGLALSVVQSVPLWPVGKYFWIILWNLWTFEMNLSWNESLTAMLESKYCILSLKWLTFSISYCNAREQVLYPKLKMIDI